MNLNRHGPEDTPTECPRCRRLSMYAVKVRRIKPKTDALLLRVDRECFWCEPAVRVIAERREPEPQLPPDKIGGPRPSEETEMLRAVRCSYCGSPPGVACVSASGVRLVGQSNIHGARVKAAMHKVTM